MKTTVSALAVVAATLVGCTNDFTRPNRAAAASDDLVFRAHFIGSDDLLKDPNARQLRQVWNLKSTADLRNRALDRFAGLPYAWLRNSLPANSPDQASLFRGLLNDALAHESFVEQRTSPSFLLAAKVPEARAAAWDTNLKQAAAAWKFGAPQAFERNNAKGWEATRQGGPSLRFVRAGDWVALTIGHAAAALETNVLSRLAQGRRGGAWLEGDANLEHFKTQLPVLASFNDLPAAHFSLSNRTDFVRTLVEFSFPRPHQWRPEPWQIPTNVIWDPLSDFTVARGVSRVLGSLPVLRDLGWNPAPSQVTGWGARGLPFQVYYAVPARDATNELKRIESRLRSSVGRSIGTNILGQIVWDANRSEVAWRGLPLAAPTVGALSNAPFLALEFFPMIKTRQPPPRELFDQFQGRNDVVLYDWESTQYRIPTWRQMYQLAEIVTGRRLSPTNSPSERWQTEVAPLVQDSVTELRATSPTGMTLVRKSSIGLTAFELVTLSRWIESSSFPAFDVFPPQQPLTPPAGRSGNRRP